MVGESLSHYKITAELGRGGMGIVYKAEDTKLDRTVAIKVLPSATLATEDDRTRFYREAKAAAALHHPNIASVFEIDEQVPSGAPHDAQPSPFIVMEYIDGETLEARIKKSPLKLKEAIRIATEVAEGLKAAHEKEIVHRDIKAANIMIGEGGRAKILDFGLAQTAQSTKLTRLGSTLGTIAYMSPEQARGEEVDSRSDLWSLGAVLYEMITGTHPFGGDYEQAIIYSVLNEDPEPLTALRTGVPLAVEGIVEKCLRKDVRHRYQTAADLVADLESVKAGSASRTQSGLRPAPVLADSRVATFVGGGARIHIVWAVALLAVAVAAMFAGRSTAPAPVAPLAFFEISTSTLVDGVRSQSGISPDGQKIVLEKEGKIWIRLISEPEERVFAGAEGGMLPFWSPDSKNLAFFRDGSLWKGSISGGSVSVVATGPVGGLPSGTWSADGNITFLLVGGALRSSLYTVLDRGGQVVEVVLPDSMSDIGAVFEPHFLPDGKGLLVYWNASENREDSRSGAYRISDGRAYKITGLRTSNLAYDPSGYLLYEGPAGNLWALPYEPGNEPAAKSPLLLLRNAGRPSVSNDGSLTYKISDRSPNQFGWVDKQGNELGRVGASRKSNRRPVLAPDGSYFIFIGEPNANDGVTPSNESQQIFIHQLTAGTERVYGELNGWVDDLAISYDGHRIAFQLNWDIWLTDVTGSSLEILERSPNALFSPSWTPDGKVLYSKYVDGQTDIWLRDAHPDSTARLLIATPRFESIPRLSPDSRYLAYLTGLDITDFEIYVQDYRDLNIPARRVGFGFNHLWSRDGKSLYFATTDSLYKWETPDDLAGLINRPVTLFGFDHLDLTDDRGFDISPSGDRFLMTFKTGESVEKTMLVQNWKQLLDE